MSWLFGGAKRSSREESKESKELSFNEVTPARSTNAFPASRSGAFEGLADLDPSKLHPLAGLSDTLEYLVLEDEALNALPGSETALPSRGFTDDLCYGTGTTYVTCLGIGGLYGTYEGLSKCGPNDSARLRLNTVLNSMTRRGPFLGNSAACVAVVYNIINSSIGTARGRHDIYNSVGSGVLAGMFFRSTRGPQAMLIAGGITGLAALAWNAAKKGLASGGAGHKYLDDTGKDTQAIAV